MKAVTWCLRYARPPSIAPDLLLLPYGADGLDLLGLLLAGQGKQGSTEVQKSDFRIRQL